MVLTQLEWSSHPHNPPSPFTTFHTHLDYHQKRYTDNKLTQVLRSIVHHSSVPSAPPSHPLPWVNTTGHLQQALLWAGQKPKHGEIPLARCWETPKQRYAEHSSPFARLLLQPAAVMPVSGLMQTPWLLQTQPVHRPVRSAEWLILAWSSHDTAAHQCVGNFGIREQQQIISHQGPRIPPAPHCATFPLEIPAHPKRASSLGINRADWYPTTGPQKSKVDTILIQERPSDFKATASTSISLNAHIIYSLNWVPGQYQLHGLGDVEDISTIPLPEVFYSLMDRKCCWWASSLWRSDQNLPQSSPSSLCAFFCPRITFN